MQTIILSKNKKTIRTIFWIFFFLLLTEGICRRWLFPQFNNVFLLARDPFVLYAVYLGLKFGYIRASYPKMFIIVGIITFFTTLLFGHGNIVVAFYGVRITILYFPFCYVCSCVLTREDVYFMGKVLVLMLVPMCVLNIIQFFSPQSSFVNIGVGGDEEGAGFSGARGYFRPPGIFTFISALTDYYAITLGFLLFFLLNDKVSRQIGIKNIYLKCAFIAYLISIPVSISRTHMVQTLFVFAFALILIFKSKKTASFLIKVVVAILILFSLLMLNKDFQLFIDVFLDRFNGANESEGGFGTSAVERTFGWAIRALEKSPLLGFGEGHFSNFGMKLIMGDVDRYYGDLAKVADATEMEWGRIICEDGIFFGLIIILLRLSMCLSIIKKSLYYLIRNNDYLLWLLMPITIFSIAIFQLKASYNLGFMTVITIATLTLINDNKSNKIRR